MTTIKSILISGYRSFPEEATPLPLSDGINLFIGPNKSGKTNFCNALRLLFGSDPDHGHSGHTSTPRGESFKDVDFHHSCNKEIVVEVELKDGKKYKCTVPRTGMRKLVYDHSPDWQNSPLFSMGYTRTFSSLGKNIDKSRTSLTMINIKNDLGRLSKQDPEFKVATRNVSHQDPMAKLVEEELSKGLRLDSLEMAMGVTALLYFVFSIRLRPQSDIFLIEEPEIGLHPRWQKLLLAYFNILADEGKQFLLTSHSPFFINNVRDTKTPSVFRIHNSGLGSKIEPMNKINKLYEAFDQLGIMASDVLQPNAIVWVEGKTDGIYVNHWLREFAKAENLFPLREGIHYQILTYGGDLSQLSLEDPAEEDKIRETKVSKFAEKLGSLQGINRNFFVILDRDQPDGLKKGRQKIVKQFPEKNTWITDQGLAFECKVKPCKTSDWIDGKKYAIEAYLSTDYLDWFKKQSVPPACKERHYEGGTKNKLAGYFEKWLDNKEEKPRKEKIFGKGDLEQRISTLYKRITGWNGI